MKPKEGKYLTTSEEIANILAWFRPKDISL